MAKANATSKCSKWAHKWDCGLCTVCFEEHPAERASRVWNAMIRRIVAAGADAYGPVPPPPDYSTREAIQDRCLEVTGNRWYRELVTIGRQDGRAYRGFKRAVERAGGTPALPFPTLTTIPVTTAPAARNESRRPRRVHLRVLAGGLTA